ncbi:SGNH/GDSL hydrolase family protein [Zavarzinia sp. CC-PAN008]|uniref:SGNH/GDSL hydrolase family protein n=1 Tax=Zavarzinia sp. CC-PAN008 TaxID=3243332 RepID=UPI003F74A51F
MKRSHPVRRAAETVGLLLAGVVLAVLAGEALVRLATMNQGNYVVEMWRYATLLKRPSDDPAIGHEHVPGSHAQLQNVEVAINSLGLRGPEPKTDARRRIAIIGDSLALGWGVPDAESLRGQLQAALPADVDVINDGVGNMNLSQIAAHWARTNARLPVDTVILVGSIRAPVIQPEPTRNPILRNSALSAVLVTYLSTLTSGATGREDMVARVRTEWTSGPGAAAMHEAFAQIAAQAQAHGQKVILASVPEMHDLDDYAFGFATEIQRAEAATFGWSFIDLRPALLGKPATAYWVTEQDLHLNADATARIARALLPLVGS